MNENYIRGIIKKKNFELDDEYYNSIAVLKDLNKLDFNKPVTFFVGENGTGKSTVLEAIAVAHGFNPEGGSINFNFESKSTHSNLYKQLTLVKGAKRPQDGFFLRAEDFYNVATEIDNLNDSADVFLDNYGGKSLHKQSHGESFLSLIQYRFHGNGLYLLDEPEAALSPQRLLTMLIYINKLVQENSQFIIVTHSPILLGYRDADIYSFDNGEIQKIKYEETESYFITKTFLDDPDRMLANLFDHDY